MAMLEIRDLEVNYGAINAIKKISFDVNEGEVIALIGANGAGKTTTLHTITGLLKAKSGSVKFEGKELTKMPPHKIVEMGMAHVPEGRRIFQQLSVFKNLEFWVRIPAKTSRNTRRIWKWFMRNFRGLKKEKVRLRVLCQAASGEMLAMGRALICPARRSF